MSTGCGMWLACAAHDKWLLCKPPLQAPKPVRGRGRRPAWWRRVARGGIPVGAGSASPTVAWPSIGMLHAASRLCFYNEVLKTLGTVLIAKTARRHTRGLKGRIRLLQRDLDSTWKGILSGESAACGFAAMLHAANCRRGQRSRRRTRMHAARSDGAQTCGCPRGRNPTPHLFTQRTQQPVPAQPVSGRSAGSQQRPPQGQPVAQHVGAPEEQQQPWATR